MCLFAKTGVTEGDLTKSIMMMMIMNDSLSETREGNLKRKLECDVKKLLLPVRGQCKEVHDERNEKRKGVK